MDDLCAEMFPVKDSIIKGDSVLLFDTLFIEGEITIDTMVTKDSVFITTVKRLPAQTITKTIYKVDFSSH